MYYLASTMHVNHAHRMRGNRWADDPKSHADMAAKVPQTMAASAAYVDKHGLRGDFVLGDTLSLADPYLFVVSAWLQGDGVAIADTPRLAAFCERMAQRPSVQAAVAQGMIRV
jgi:glutathione S-transferase